VQRYLVRRDGQLVADVYATTAGDSSLPASHPTVYEVTPVDPAGNAGPPVSIAVTGADVTPPAAPSGLVAAAHGSTADLSWAASSDDIGVVSYEVDRDGVAIAQGLTETALAGTGLLPGTHSYTVRAWDAAGNVSAPSAGASVTLVSAAVIPPVVTKTVVKQVSVFKLKRLGTHRVLVSWKAQKGAARYQVLRPSGKKAVLLATIRKLQYVDGHAARGTLSKKRYLVRALSQ
jgi:hypothetical protein